jgi:Na+-translocating ferredoxin:NAD+ oxidoreductase RNF subunit RnfB
MTKTGSTIHEIIDLLQGQQHVVNNRKAYSAKDARFRTLKEGEINGCKSCLHKCESNCNIVDTGITDHTTCHFQVGSSQSQTRGNNITMDIEDLFKS